MFKIARYSIEKKEEWNGLINRSKNGTFLFHRDYMDYHSDRFEDHSLLIYRKEKLEGVFVANEKAGVIYSHQGLTYGGLVYTSKLGTLELLEVFNLIIAHYKFFNIHKIIYKSIPFIYAQQPAQEDLYVLYKNEFKQIGCNISSTIYLQDKIPFIESRKSGVRKAKNENLKVKESSDFNLFWNILNLNLTVKYDTKAVHSLEEIVFLCGKFPANIKLYLVYDGNEPLAGTVLYITKKVVHTQYISASPEGKAKGALDLLFDFLINIEYPMYEYFDFGQSTEKMGEYLNENLIFQKEGFGGRGIVYTIYEKEL
jgi:hypothetical protein